MGDLGPKEKCENLDVEYRFFTHYKTSKVMFQNISGHTVTIYLRLEGKP